MEWQHNIDNGVGPKVNLDDNNLTFDNLTYIPDRAGRTFVSWLGFAIRGSIVMIDTVKFEQA